MSAGMRPRRVYLSAVGVREDAGDAYIRAHGRVEATVRASRLPFTSVRPSFITRPDRDDARPLEHVAIVDAVVALRPRRHRAACDSYRSITHMTLTAAILRRTWDLSPGSCLKDQRTRFIARRGLQPPD